MSELEQNLDPEWGYTKKGETKYRPLTIEEHQRVLELRVKETEHLNAIIRHTQRTIERAVSRDPSVNDSDIVVIVVHGMKAFNEISDWMGFNELNHRFHFGAPLGGNSWLVSVSDAILLKEKFPDNLHYPDEADVLKTVSRIVTPYAWDPASIKANPIELD